MTEQEAFEKWWRDTNTVGMVTTAEAGWRAALEWARSQQEPIGVVGFDAVLWKNGVRPPENTPLFAAPVPPNS